MKTYSEEKNEQAINWNDFLNKTAYTDDELATAVLNAGNWIICPCGQQCVIIPRRFYGAPEDFELKMLGERFSLKIMAMIDAGSDLSQVNFRREQALKVLKEIEQRSAQLIDLIVENDRQNDLLPVPPLP